MKPNKISVTIITIPNCPACDRLKIIVDDLLANNKFLKKYVTEVSIKRFSKKHNEFPVFQIYNNETGNLVYEVIGCYGQATVFWKLIKWIMPNGK